MDALPDPNRESAERVLREHEEAAEKALRDAAAAASMKKPTGFRKPLAPRQGECPAHGAYTSMGFMFGRREIWPKCPECATDEAKAQAQQEASELANRERRARDSAITKAGITKRYHGLGFASFDADTDAMCKALMMAEDFARQFPEMLSRGSGLVFAGRPGTGKTLLATAIVQSLIDDYSVRYVTCQQLIRMVRETWNKGSAMSTTDMYRALGEDLQLLVIDEVGVQQGTDNELNILFEVLDRRYSEMLPTILVTNASVADFKKLVGERVYDRLSETATWVVFAWESHRPKARRAD